MRECKGLLKDYSVKCEQVFKTTEKNAAINGFFVILNISAIGEKD